MGELLRVDDAYDFSSEALLRGIVRMNRTALLLRTGVLRQDCRFPSYLASKQLFHCKHLTYGFVPFFLLLAFGHETTASIERGRGGEEMHTAKGNVEMRCTLQEKWTAEARIILTR